MSGAAAQHRHLFRAPVNTVNCTAMAAASAGSGATGGALSAKEVLARACLMTAPNVPTTHGMTEPLNKKDCEKEVTVRALRIVPQQSSKLL